MLEEHEKLRAEHLNGILLDLCISVLPRILGRDIEEDGYLLDDYGMDCLDGAQIEDECERRWRVTLGKNLGVLPSTVITPRDLAKAVQKAQDDACAHYERHRQPVMEGA